MFVFICSAALAEDLEITNNEESAVKVSMEDQYLNGDILKISVEVEELKEGVIGAAFHLEFDDEKLEFLKYEPGTFLEQGGDPFYMVTVEEGAVVFGSTLRRDDEFPSGSGSLVFFFFQIEKEDKFAFNFSRGTLSTVNSIRQDLASVEWVNLLSERSEQQETPVQISTDVGKVSWIGTLLKILKNPLFVAVNAVLFSYVIMRMKHKWEQKRP